MIRVSPCLDRLAAELPTAAPEQAALPLAGFVVAALGLAALPLVALAVRRIFPGRNVVFARWGFSHVALAALAGVLLLGATQAIHVTDLDTLDPLIELLRSTAVLGLVAALVAAFARRLDPAGERALGLWPGRNVRAVLAGAAAYALCFPALLAVNFVWPWILRALGETVEPQAILEQIQSVPRAELGWVLVLAVLVQPLLEEILFRAFLQPLLVQNLNAAAGVAATSLVFAALHGTSAFLPVFALSLLLGSVMLRTQRLAAPWAVHALHNGLMLALTLAGASGSGAEPA